MLGFNLCNKTDKEDINYQTMMPIKPYYITDRDINMIPL